jgi:hypothetical protein
MRFMLAAFLLAAAVPAAAHPARPAAKVNRALTDHVIPHESPRANLPAFLKWVDKDGKAHQRHGTAAELSGKNSPIRGGRLVQWFVGQPGTRWMPLFGGDY